MHIIRITAQTDSVIRLNLNGTFFYFFENSFVRQYHIRRSFAGLQYKFKKSELPILFQHTINKDTQIGVWKIEEPEDFFTGQITLPQLPPNQYKRLQHLAGRYLLQHMLPEFPLHLIQSTPAQKPFLSDNSYHFSISHSGNMAAAIISHNTPVGIDLEFISDKAGRVSQKFLHASELKWLEASYEKNAPFHTTLLWSIKETIFKWYGLGNVDFKHDIQIHSLSHSAEINTATCIFKHANPETIHVSYMKMGEMILSWK